MKFMLLLYDEEGVWERASEEAKAAVYAQFGEFDAALAAAGKAPAEGYELGPSSQAKLLHGGGAEGKVTDGPFAETVEQLGGYYVLDCADIDEAVEWARRLPQLPDAPGGAIEVRPIVEHEE